MPDRSVVSLRPFPQTRAPSSRARECPLHAAAFHQHGGIHDCLTPVRAAMVLVLAGARVTLAQQTSEKVNQRGGAMSASATKSKVKKMSNAERDESVRNEDGPLHRVASPLHDHVALRREVHGIFHDSEEDRHVDHVGRHAVRTPDDQSEAIASRRFTPLRHTPTFLHSSGEMAERLKAPVC